jgi:5-methylcytosine-specific restriction enzyme subunit McrC
MFLLAYATDPNGWKKVEADFAVASDVFSALASGFSWHATRAVERGLLRGYVQREERRNDIRGRVRFADQIARSAGLPIPVSLGYDEFTEDVSENRMLRTASELLLLLPRIPLEARQRLQRLRIALESVDPLIQWRGIKAPPITRLNARYETALRLAELILASASISANAGGVRSTTFVFDMNKVFEAFVTIAFRASMRRYGGVVKDQVTPHSLDEGGALKLKPDLSWWTGSDCRAVLDAKYKAIDDGLMRHGDAYQMLAYCTAYGLSRGYLVYAKDAGAQTRTHHVRNTMQQIVVETLDVEQKPDDLLRSVDALASRVVTDARSELRAA